MNLYDELSCPYCSVGVLRRRKVTYVWMFGQTLVTVPNMPTAECDVCGRRDYDQEIVQRVEALVIPSGAPPNRYQPVITARKPKRQSLPRSGTGRAPVAAPKTSKTKKP